MREAHVLPPRPGFSLLETAIASVLVGVLLVAAMRTIGASTFAQHRSAERVTGEFLADGLLAEILAKDYQDPSGVSEFGPGPDESSKKDFDDVDDYHGWSESPPQNADGTPMPGLEGWRRTVAVVAVNSSTPTLDATGETGVKRITVVVEHNGTSISSRTALRTKVP